MGVRCSKCQHENPDDTLYCGKCASPLQSAQGISLTRTLITPKESLQKGSSFAGRYQLIEELGRGGMGVVYQAEDTKLKRKVALKFLPHELTHIAEIKERFKREAQAAAALDHPNICTVYEFDESEERSFISMAYIEGQNLRKKIESGPLELDEAIKIATQVIEGLQEAHRKGVIHRDIKSANIMVTDTGQAKIMDFGLARMTDSTLLTQRGTAMGTIAYMSPEQAYGESVDHRSDIWSLGVVLYEMFSGQLPFKGEHEQAVVYSIRKDDPKPLTELRSEIPDSLSQVINRALEKDPDDRYQQTEELLDDLNSISAGIVPDKIRARLRKATLHKRKRIISYAGIAGFIVIAAFITLNLFMGRAEAINSIAVLPIENLTGDAKHELFVDAATDELIGQLAQIKAWRVISRRSIMQYKNSDKTLLEIARELGVDAVVEGAVHQAGNNVRMRVQLMDVKSEERNLWAETYEKAKTDVLLMYSEMARAIAGEARVKLTAEETKRLSRIRQVNPEAYDAYLKGSYHWKKLTPEELDTAQKYFELALEKDPNFAQAYGSIAFIWMARATSEAAAAMPHEAAPKAKEAAKKSLELDSTLAEPHFALAGIATWYDWEWDTAEREFRLAINYNPNFADAYVFYGLYLTAMRRTDEAIENMEKALELDPHNFMYHTYLGTALLRGRQYDKAIPQFQKGLELEPNFLDALGGLWSAYHQKGMFEDALAIAKRHFTARGELDVVEAIELGNAEGGYATAMRSAADVLASHSSNIYALRIATIYTFAEEKVRALDWIEKAYQERLQNMVYLNVHPKWDPLRDEPRFQDLLRRMNYPADEQKNP